MFSKILIKTHTQVFLSQLRYNISTGKLDLELLETVI